MATNKIRSRFTFLKIHFKGGYHATVKAKT